MKENVNAHAGENSIEKIRYPIFVSIILYTANATTRAAAPDITICMFSINANDKNITKNRKTLSQMRIFLKKFFTNVAKHDIENTAPRITSISPIISTVIHKSIIAYIILYSLLSVDIYINVIFYLYIGFFIVDICINAILKKKIFCLSYHKNL